MNEIHNSQPEGLAEALVTFKKCLLQVPAYQKFLEENSVERKIIKNPKEFAELPVVTKENYLRKYPLNELLAKGNISDGHVISMSSGSSGQPFFWFRNEIATRQSIDLYDSIFTNSFSSREKSTLAIIGFGMGTWIGGTYTFTGLQHLSENDHLITSITPGINKTEILYIIKTIGNLFDQIVIVGYPPFVKDVLDEAEENDIDLKKYNISLLFAGENISEKWRHYVLSKIGKEHDLYASVAIYGTADAGIMGHENPFSIFVRQRAAENEALSTQLFGTTRVMPTLVTYNPRYRFVEEVDSNLLFTCDNAMPLVRYQINDQGKLFSGNQLLHILKEYDIHVPENLLIFCNLPYLALHGRSDIVTTYYAIDIYPENIKAGLEDHDLQRYITGKFVAETSYTQDQDQQLHIFVELRKAVVPMQDLIQLLSDSVVQGMRTNSSEYNKLYSELGESARPILHLLPHNSKEFQITTKHKWIKKTPRTQEL